MKIKNVKAISKENEFNFCRGDYVFEIAGPIYTHKPVGNAIIRVLHMLCNDGKFSWEACTDETGRIYAFALHHITGDAEKNCFVIKKAINDMFIKVGAVPAPGYSSVNVISRIYHLV